MPPLAAHNQDLTVIMNADRNIMNNKRSAFFNQVNTMNKPMPTTAQFSPDWGKTRKALAHSSPTSSLPPRSRASSFDTRSPSQSPRFSDSSHRGSSSHGGNRSFSSNGSGSPAQLNTIPDTVESLERAAEIQDTPSRCPLYNRLGNLHFRNGRMDLAMAAYRQAVLTGDACNPGSQEHLAAAYANLGTVYWTTGKVDSAVSVLQQALSIYELDLASMGKTLHKASFSSNAIQIANCFHQLGLCQALQGEFSAALSTLERAMTIRETLVRTRRATEIDIGRTLEAIGKVYWMQGDVDEALKAYEKAYRLYCSQESLPFQALITLQNMANCHMSIQNHPAALAVLVDVKRICTLRLSTQRAPDAKTQEALLGVLQAMVLALEATGQTKEIQACHDEIANLEAAMQDRRSASP